MKKLLTIAVIALFLCPFAGFSQVDSVKTKRVQWFVDARFGMFIHFGLYSIPAGVWKGQLEGRNMYAEWIQKQGNWPYGIPDKEYQALAGQFNPTKFNAEEWVLEAKNAGMKYIVITTKHHDGFALWPSKVSKFNVMDATPFKRDIVGELTKACRKYGLKIGFYYSHWQDWEYDGGAKPPPEFKSIPPPEQVSDEKFGKYWENKCIPQVKELIENYHPDLFWFDTWQKPAVITDQRLDELIGMIHKLAPNCLINSRIRMSPDVANKVDFLSMDDNSFPKELISQPWETPGTMNYSWGYHQLDFHWESTKGLLTKLVANASRNGTFQLNVGPKSDGTFPAAAVRRLREMGAWLYVNNQAIYGTKPSPFKGNSPYWGYITCRKGEGDMVKIYLHVVKWPENRELMVPGIRILPEKAYVLETGQKLDFTPYPETAITLRLPYEPIDPNITVIVLEINNKLAKLIPNE